MTLKNVKCNRFVKRKIPVSIFLSHFFVNFAVTESATLLVGSANQGGSFILKTMTNFYLKQPLSIADQINLLNYVAHGLIQMVLMEIGCMQ